jgi:hypothetical protein
MVRVAVKVVGLGVWMVVMRRMAVVRMHVR